MIDQLLTALSTMGKSFGKHFTSLKASIDALPEKMGLAKAIEGQTRILARYADRLESTASALRSTKLDVAIDTEAMEAQLREIADELRGIETPDLSNIEASLKALATLMEKQASTSTKAITEGFSKLSETIKALKTDKQEFIKLDDMQFRALRTGGGGGGGAAQGRKPTLTNTTIANASTEYSYTFPPNTTSWTIKLRDQDKLAYYSWTTGKLPTSGDGSLYFTMPQNYLRSIENVDYSGRTIYFGAEGATVAELEIFQA